jgi:hypothetical protein
MHEVTPGGVKPGKVKADETSATGSENVHNSLTEALAKKRDPISYEVGTGKSSRSLALLML